MKRGARVVWGTAAAGALALCELAATAGPSIGTRVSADAGAGDDLHAEAPEGEPRSQIVKLRLDVYPRSAQAVVWWGAKKLGVAREPIEIERPRASGPMDLVIKAPGYLEHHTRLFTDRNDRLSVTLRPAARPPTAESP